MSCTFCDTTYNRKAQKLIHVLKHEYFGPFQGLLNDCLRFVWGLFGDCRRDCTFREKPDDKKTKMLLHVLKHEYPGSKDIDNMSDVLTDRRSIWNDLQLSLTKECLNRRPYWNNSFEVHGIGIDSNMWLIHKEHCFLNNGICWYVKGYGSWAFASSWAVFFVIQLITEKHTSLYMF